MTVLRGDCVEVMAGMEPGSVDAIVCDPPYDLLSSGDRNGSGRSNPGAGPFGRTEGRGGFMGQRWDATGVAFRPETWAAALRVAKPGAYLLAFGGTRTVHRMTCALEDAGWVIRDMLVWAYAQGFPKSRASLKPAWEPIVLCRKPGSSRDLNIDAARIGTGEGGDRDGEASADRRYGHRGVGFQPTPGPRGGDPAGRWPSNVILTDPILDGGWDGVVGGGWQSGGGNPARRGSEAMSRAYGGFEGGETGLTPADTEGTYSRFFLIGDGRSSVLSGTMEPCRCTPADSADGSTSTRETARRSAPEPAPQTPSGPSDPSASGADSPSLWAGTSTAPRPAPTQRDGTQGSTAIASTAPALSGPEPTTSRTASPSSSAADASMPSTPRSRPPATSPGSTPPSDPARSMDATSPATATTTTTSDPSTCAICAGRITSPGTSRQAFPSPEAPGAARFLLIPKAPTRERVLSDGRRSPHPTQKPEALIRHLVTLVTPPGGLVLDPFLGSGTLGVVCDGLGMRWQGIEREPEYADWAEDRIADRPPALWGRPA